MQYIGVVAVCYALVAALWTVIMKRRCTGALRILEVLAVILVALVLALSGALYVNSNRYNYEYNMKKYAEGIYFFVISNNNRVLTKKVLVIH